MVSTYGRTSAGGDDDDWPILQAGFQNYIDVICIIKKNYLNLQLLRSRRNWSEKNSIKSLNKLIKIYQFFVPEDSPRVTTNKTFKDSIMQKLEICEKKGKKTHIRLAINTVDQ